MSTLDGYVILTALIDSAAGVVSKFLAFTAVADKHCEDDQRDMTVVVITNVHAGAETPAVSLHHLWHSTSTYSIGIQCHQGGEVCPRHPVIGKP